MKDRQHARTPARDLTPWYPAEVVPVNPGVYQMLNTSSGMLFYSRWNGEAWCVGCLEAEAAASFTRESVVQLRWPWRGLTEQSC